MTMKAMAGFGLRMLGSTDLRLLWKIGYNFAYKGMRSVEKFKARLKEGVVFPPFLSSAIAAALPCGEAHLIPHAGHSPYFEQAATFNALVDAFLARQR